MEKRRKISYTVYCLSLLTILAMATLPLMHVHFSAMPYIYAVAAGLTFISRILFPPYKGGNKRISRLNRMEIASSVCYCVSAGYFFYNGTYQRDWLAFLTVGATLQVYSTFMISLIEARERRKNGIQ